MQRRRQGRDRLIVHERTNLACARRSLPDRGIPRPLEPRDQRLVQSHRPSCRVITSARVSSGRKRRVSFETQCTRADLHRGCAHLHDGFGLTSQVHHLTQNEHKKTALFRAVKQDASSVNQFSPFGWGGTTSRVLFRYDLLLRFCLRTRCPSLHGFLQLLFDGSVYK